MKKLIAVTVLAMTCLVLQAQEATSTPKGFTDDFDAALLASKKSGKPLYAVFSGSDWCYWCKVLEQNCLSKPEFVEAASKKFELVFIDSPRDKSRLSEKARARNPALMQKYRIRGFPTVLFINADGEMKRAPRPGNDMTMKAYVEQLEQRVSDSEWRNPEEVQSSERPAKKKGTPGVLTARNLTPENHLSGPQLTERDLRGKVILLEYFGAGCGPCMAAMPHTIELAEKLKKDKRFVFLLSHAWPGPEKAKAFLERAKATHLPAYQQVALGDARVPGGVPNALVFNHKGELVWRGHPASQSGTEMDDAITKALSEIPDLASLKSAKLNHDLTKRIAMWKNLESVRKTLAIRAKKGDAKGEEAKALLDKINAWIADQKGKINRAEKSRPSLALHLLRRLSKMVPSETTDHQAKLAELQKDEVTLALEGIRRKIEKLEEKNTPPKSPAYKKLKKQLAAFDQSSKDVQDILALFQ